MHRHRCRNEKARGCEPFKCRLRIRPGLFLNGFFSIRNTVCWSFLRVHYAGYVYPAAFARLSPKVRDLVVVAGAHLLLNVNQRLHIATLWAGINRYVLSPQRKEHRSPGWHRLPVFALFNALTCCALRFVEPTPPESHRQDHHIGIWCWLTESNRRHPAYKAGALPTELNQQIAHFTDRLFKPLGFQFNAYTTPPEQSSLL